MSRVGYADDNTLIYHDRAGTIQRWDVKDAAPRVPLDKDTKYVRIALSDNGGFLAGVTQNDKLKVWDLAKRKVVHTTSVDAETDSHLLISRSGQRVAYTAKGQRPPNLEYGDVLLIDFENPSRKTDNASLRRVAFYAWQAFTPDSKQLLVQRAGLTKYSSHLLDITTDPIESRYEVEGWGPEKCAAFSPDGATLASGSYGFDIRLYDAASGELQHTLRGHTDQVRCLAFTRDGSRLVSAGDDATVRIWKLGESACRLVSTLRGHSGHIESVAVSPSGTSVAAVHDGGSLSRR